MGASGLRERKKNSTHRAIQRAAVKLFSERGYHATTIAAIAEAADVSPRTVSVHFPGKEDLLFADATAMDELAMRLEHRRGQETALDALRDWIFQMLDSDERFESPDEMRSAWEDARTRRAIVDADPSLRQLERAHYERAERMIASAVARDMGQTPDELAPQMAAAAAVAVFAVLERTPPTEPNGPPSVAAALELVDLAIRFVRGGMAAIAE